MSHEEHSHEEHDFDEHESHHDDYSDHENHHEEEYEYDEIEEEIEEEFEEKEFRKINDITNPEEKSDVDISSFFDLPILGVLRNLFKKNTLDVKGDLKEEINLSFKPIIKLLKLKKSFDNIKKSKKNNQIHLNDYIPEVDENSINLLDIENFYSETGPFSDIKKPKVTINTLVNKQIKKSTQKIKKINFIKFGTILFFVFIFLFSYLYYTKYKVLETFSSLQNLEINSDIKKIKKDLIKTKRDLIISDILLKPIVFINYFIQNQDVKNLNNIISGTKNLVNFGINSLVIYDGIYKLIEEKGFEEVMYSQLINNINPIISEMNLEINSSVLDFEKIQNLGDDKLNDLFFKKVEMVKSLQSYFKIFYVNKDILLSMLGDEKKKTYLIVFQNNDEIRPTGGFMGSVGILQIFKGKIINFEQKDIYALEWNIKPFLEKAPEGINKISDTFGLRDANYFIDIKESSEKIKSFLDKTDYKIDGIVYINQNLIINALKDFGGIYFSDVKREITSENFSYIISTLVEAKITRTHTLATPKQILFDFSKEFFTKLKNDKNYLGYLKLFTQSIEKKDIIFYSFLEKENAFLKEIGLTTTDNFTNYLDFNYPVFTSISGNKSDRYIKIAFEKNIKLNPDCSINTRLNITLKHEFNLTQEINIKNLLYDMNLLDKVDIENTLQIQGKGLNKQFVRILLPKNALVVENENIKVKSFPNYKQVSFYITTEPLLESSFSVGYKLENKECLNYNYEFVKQPGIKDYNLILNKDGNLVNSVYTDKNYIFNN